MSHYWGWLFRHMSLCAAKGLGEYIHARIHTEYSDISDPQLVPHHFIHGCGQKSECHLKVCDWVWHETYVPWFPSSAFARNYSYLSTEIKQLFSFPKQAPPCEQSLDRSLSHTLSSLFPTSSLHLSLKTKQQQQKFFLTYPLVFFPIS